MSYKIKANADFPETRGRNAKYPFAELEVGDSFDVPIRDGKPTASGMSSTGRWWSRHLLRKLGAPRRVFAVRHIYAERVLRVKRTK